MQVKIRRTDNCGFREELPRLKLERSLIPRGIEYRVVWEGEVSLDGKVDSRANHARPRNGHPWGISLPCLLLPLFCVTFCRCLMWTFLTSRFSASGRNSQVDSAAVHYLHIKAHTSEVYESLKSRSYLTVRERSSALWLPSNRG